MKKFLGFGKKKKNRAVNIAKYRKEERTLLHWKLLLLFFFLLLGAVFGISFFSYTAFVAESGREVTEGEGLEIIDQEKLRKQITTFEERNLFFETIKDAVELDVIDPSL